MVLGRGFLEKFLEIAKVLGPNSTTRLSPMTLLLEKSWLDRSIELRR
jgi:hypothetical protein